MIAPRFGDYPIQTTNGPATRRGIIGEHWALTMESGRAIAHSVRSIVTDLASGHGSPPIRITPLEAVLLIQRLDARGPASTTDETLNAGVVDELRPFFEASDSR